jgi:hypothetical protein
MDIKNWVAVCALVGLTSQGVHAEVYDVRTYRASTASSNNSPAIQAAINAAQLAGGGQIYIPDSYRCASGIVISGAANLSLRGDADRSGMFFEGCQCCHRRDRDRQFNQRGDFRLRLIGSSATPTASRLVGIYGGSYMKIYRNFFAGANREPNGGPTAALPRQLIQCKCTSQYKITEDRMHWENV